MQQPFITTIRDLVIGMGAGHTEVELYRRNEENYLVNNEWIHVASKCACIYFLRNVNSNNNEMIYCSVTDAGGRMLNLVTPDEFPIGVYKLVFQTGKYYEAKNSSTFYPYLEILFKKSTLNPILIVVSLSPYGYSYDLGFDIGLSGIGTTSQSPGKICFIPVLCIMFYMFSETNF